MSEESKSEEIEIEVEERPVYCYACGDQLNSRSILICAECLGDECEAFLKQALEIPKK